MQRILQLSLILNLLFLGILDGQTVWPGDINENGQVNPVDLLYFGVANGDTGAQRDTISTLWQSHDVNQLWTNNFSTNINYAKADCDGNGVIDSLDYDLALKANNTLEHTVSNPTPEGYLEGTEGVDPAIVLTPSTTMAYEGDTVQITLELGSESLPVTDFYGLAVYASYTSSLVEDNTEITFNTTANSWVDPTGQDSKTMISSDDATGIARFGITRTNKNNIPSGHGPMGVFVIGVEDIVITPYEVDTLRFKIDSVLVIDNNLTAKAIALPASASTSILISKGNRSPVACPKVVDPVVAINGNTYLNSCFAEHDGQFDYVSGTGFGDCINVEEIDLQALADCNDAYEPVCGCNNVTYKNECEAKASGVQNYVPGQCPTATDCFDKEYILTSGHTKYDEDTGFMATNCDDSYEPVCGCNGITYRNACLAEASGVVFYTAGSCSSDCIDVDQMDPSVVINTAYDPVCGCNNVTYSNAQAATAAGIQSYTSGACGANAGASSAWCSKAKPIQCGDFFAYESTSGAGNDIENYPGCSTVWFKGNDKVYVISKTSAGDLQIGLEILTPNVDLDLFLLAGDCSAVSCIKSSTTDNKYSNNEGIVYEDAPIGTYYIVVDAQYAGVVGDFRLEVNCGYLDCSNAVSLSCGTTYNGNTSNGQNNVSLYSCSGNVQNVENNGPEIVHTFTTTATGNVDIALDMWNANLELFLLNSCDRGGCLDYSSNPGYASEHISTYLPAGTYYVVVDGYNGASGEYALKVDCAASCDLNISCVSTHSNCGQNTGKIVVSSTGGTPSYIVSWTGPVSNSISTSSNQTTISNLPSGIYTVTKTDVNGCSDTKTVEVQDGSNFSFVATGVNAVCSTKGKIHVVTNGGNIPFRGYLTGRVTGTTRLIYSTSFDIVDLPAGDYTLTVVDKNGCSDTHDVTIGQDNNNFDFTATPSAAACGQLGKILVQTVNGIPNYTVSITGPVNKTGYSTGSSFWIENLPAGTYYVTVEDGNWCSQTKKVVIESTDLSFSVTPHNGLCNQKGSIDIVINNGTPNYQISWNGPNGPNGSGSVQNSTNTYTIQNLIAGTYTINISDANNCSHYKVVTISNSNSTLLTTATPIPGNCGYGSIWIDLNSGVAPYTISWTGASSNNATTSNNGYDITNLPVGSYWISITDANGCSSTHDVVLTGTASAFNITTSIFDGSCGSTGHIAVHMHDGDGPYTVSWSGPSSDSDVSTGSNYQITNLASGIYSITVTDSNGCDATTTATINNSSLSNLFNTNPIAGTCGEKGKIELTFVAGQPPYSISWTGPSSDNGQTSTNVFDINHLVSGTYSISVTDDGGCTQTKSVSLTNQSSIVGFTLTPKPGDCGITGEIFVDITSGSPDFDISWTGPTAATSGSTTTGEDWYNITALISGIYEVTVTDDTGCSLTKTITLNNTASNITFVLGAAPGACGHGGTIWVDVKTGEPDFTLDWTGPASSGGSITQTSPWFDLNDLPSGDYTLKITDNTGCYKIKQITLNNSDEQLSVVATPTNGTCGEQGSIWLEITGGATPFTIKWSGPETDSTTTNNYSHDISNLTSGHYSVTVTDANGCSTTQSLSVYNTNVFNLTATSNNGHCNGNGSILVNMHLGTPNYSVVWKCTSCSNTDSDGATVVDNESYLIQNLAQGIYSIVVTDGSGCSANIYKTVSTTTSNLSIETMVTNAKCNALGSIWIDIQGGQADYTITWGNGNSKTISTKSWDINGLSEGTYTIVVTDANGCSVSKTITVGTDDSNLDFTTTATPISCGTPGSIDISISNGQPYYTISWDGPQTNSVTSNENNYTLTDLVAGTYSITVVDAAGCSKYRNVVINNNGGGLNVDFTLTNSNCGVAGSIWLDFSNGVAPYAIQWSGTASGNDTTNKGFYDITGLYIGNYTVTVTDANGCNIIQSVELEGSEALSVSVTSTNGSCQNNDGVIYVAMNNGVPNYTVSWSGPQSNTVTVTGTNFTLNNLPNGDYGITVTDALGCSYSTTKTINNNSGSPIADFTSVSDSYTVTFTNTGTSGSYSWTFGDGTQSIDVNPIHEYQSTGTYNVCLTVTNSCGSNTICKDVTVSVSGSFVVLDIENGTGPVNSIVEIPVTIQNCNLLVSLAGSIEVENSNVAEIVGLTSGVIAPQFFSVNNTFNYYANNGQGVSINDNDTLFYVNVKLIGNAGASSIVRFVNTPLPVEVGTMVNGVVTAIPYVSSTGMVNIPVSTAISGKVSTYWGEGIADVDVNVSGAGFLIEETTNEAGLFNLANIPTGSMIEISADKDVNDVNGLSTYALFAGQRFILGLDPVEITSPYQVIAGDADCSGSFSTIDLFVIQQLIIGTNDAFSACPSWVFVSENNDMPTDFDAYNVFPYDNSETMMSGEVPQVNFVGVKVGDILGQANPDGIKGNEDDDRYSENVQIDILDQSVVEGDVFEVAFSSSNFEQLVSLQGNLNFDSEKISLVDYQTSVLDPLKSIALGTSDEANGNVRISWFSLSGRGVSFTNNSYLFKLKFVANQDIDDLKNIFQFNNEGISSIAYDEDGNSLGIEIHIQEKTTATTDVQKGYALFQNIPNPFLDYTLIQFELPKRMDASITIKNNMGQIIKNVKGTFDKGVQSVRIDKKDLGVGVFYYSLETKDYFETKKMIAVD